MRNQVRSILEAGDVLIFVDECTFSPKSKDSRVWQFPGQQIAVDQRKWDYSCVACIGAVDVVFGKILLT